MGSGSSSPFNKSHAEIQPIRFIDFDDFKLVGEYPKLPECKDIARDVSTLDLSNSFVIYVSHAWLRSRPDLENYKDSPLPDTQDNEQYKICVAGVERLLLSNKVTLKKCYLWLDYSCLDQRGPKVMSNRAEGVYKVDPLFEMDGHMGQLMHYCDCMFTPDSGLAEVVRTSSLHVPQRVELTGNGGYLNRGWCRLEMFFSSFISLSEVSLQKKDSVSRALAHAFDLKRRPHFVFGAHEMAHEKAPLVVPAMRISMAKTQILDPRRGSYTRPGDINVVKRLMRDLANHHMKPVKFGYHGNTDPKGLRHGHGRYVFPSGGVYEGGYLHGLKHGFGRFEMASGDVYEGGYKSDRREGHGVFKFANGDWYEGTWSEGKPNGQGRVEYASGDVYEGHFKDHLKHGFGIFTFTSGCQYEGWYLNDMRHGQGKYVWSDGDTYNGEWKNHTKHGYGVFRFSSGAFYQGMWRADSRHGQGKYTLMNGEVYEGEYKDDRREGQGTYLFRSGAKYDGSWLMHLKNGVGKLYSPHNNELVYDGEWVNDKPLGYVAPDLIFEDDVQYMEVMAVVRQAEAAPPCLKEEPMVRVMEALAPTLNRVTSQITDEYFNEDGILDEDDDFHPKNLFRRKSEDWIDKAPQVPKTDPENSPGGSKGEEEESEYLQEFHVEREVMKMNFTPLGAVDEDRHDRVKKMFSPVRKVINVTNVVNFSPTKEIIFPSAAKNMIDPAQDEVSTEDSSARAGRDTEGITL